MAGGSSSGSFVVEVGEENPYPYPSYVCAPSFVTVKLSGREVYGLWKTQMLCLLETHGMLAFIHTISSPNQKSDRGKEKEGDYLLWRRSNALIKGWILGSLSEDVLRHVINLLKTNEDFTAKDVWDKLKTIYGPAPARLFQQSDKEAVTQPEDAESTDKEAKTEAFLTYEVEEKRKKEEMRKIVEELALNYEEKEKREKEEEKRKVAEERAKLHQRLYKATLRQDYAELERTLSNKVTLTEKITINGNTALHVAVATTKNMKFLRYMIELAVKDNPDLDMRNSEGSTLLHVAAIVGNFEAAKIFVRNRELLFAKDNEGQTPLARVLSNMHTETYLYLLHSVTAGDIDYHTAGDELIVNAISSKDYCSALLFIRSNRNLYSDAVLLAIAQNFPRELNVWERIVYLLDFSFVPEVVNNISNTVADVIIENVYEKRPKFMCYLAVGAITLLICGVFIGIIMLLWYIMWILVSCATAKRLFKYVRDRVKMRTDATDLLTSVCYMLRDRHLSSSHHEYYTNPVLEATRQNAYEVVVIIVSFFPDAISSTNEDGHNIIQFAVVNRSEKVYNLLYQMSEHKNVYKTIKDPFGNNLLHLAARLPPINKLNHISSAALQLQRELQWFKEVEGFVCPLNKIQKNIFGETPQMVFTREHKDLVIEGEKWMKATAESYTITAALITTVVFAAAITVPGGNNQETGIPIFTTNTAFTIFAICDAVSLFTSVTSLLLFLSILTTRFAEQDFLFKLPTKLVIGLAALFISTTAMILAFGATLFLVFGQKKSLILIPIAALTCLPIISFVTLQFPLIVDLVSSTYGRRIFGKKREDPFY